MTDDVPSTDIRVRLDLSAFVEACERVAAGLRSIGVSLRMRSAAPPRCYGPPPMAINGHAYHRRIRARQR